MRYFCESCDGKSPEQMMRIAMTTVESEYTVVGLLEMFNSSLAVFQQYLPGNHCNFFIISKFFPINLFIFYLPIVFF